MIIRQTTTIIFEYPQDYLQEQEWCKTKDDRWIHKGTDTLGAVYENTISYSIGQPNSSEKPNNSTISKMEQVKQRSCDTCKNRDIEGWRNPCIGCTGFAFYEPKDEPQTCSFSDCDNFKNPDYERCIECKRKQIKLKTSRRRKGVSDADNPVNKRLSQW